MERPPKKALKGPADIVRNLISSLRALCTRRRVDELLGILRGPPCCHCYYNALNGGLYKVEL